MQPTIALNGRDVYCIEYIGGYVLRKVFFNLKTKKAASDTALALLKSFKSDESNEEGLIGVLNRGGLWKISDMAMSLFILAEKKLRAETKNEARLQKIRIAPMASALTKDMDAQMLLKAILEDCPLYCDEEHSEEADNILEKLFTIYLRVRWFSLTRDLVTKLKNKAKADLDKKKALHKVLKHGDNIKK